MSSSQHHMVLEGADGFLFLKNDSSRSIDQITGKYPISVDFHQTWLELLTYRKDYFKKLGVIYRLFLIPEKSVVYDRYLPASVVVSTDRPIKHVMEAANEAAITCLYPIERMRAISIDEIAYPRGDTHWNGMTAFAAYAAVMHSIGVEPIDEARVDYFERIVEGDLSGKLGRTCVLVDLKIKDPHGVLAFYNHVPGVGSLRTYTNGAGQGTCVVFRDSYTDRVEQLFAETFKRVTFVWQPNIDQSIVESERPDYVFSLMAERFVVIVPKDVGGLSNRDYVQRKNSGLPTGIKKSGPIAAAQSAVEASLHPSRSAVRLQGVLDVASRKRIAGWVRDLSDPANRVTVILLDNGREIARQVASRFREDLKKNGVGDGFYSYEFTTADLAPGLHRFELVDETTMSAIPARKDALDALALALVSHS